MCDDVKLFRIVMFVICGLMVLTSVLTGFVYCKRNGIDFNKVSGMLEMYGKVFSFENKLFSIVMLLCIYGGAVLGAVVIFVSFWAEQKGCVFPTKYRN